MVTNAECFNSDSIMAVSLLSMIFHQFGFGTAPASSPHPHRTIQKSHAMGASAVLQLPIICFLALLGSIQGALATVTPFLVPGFHFDYGKPGQQLPIPVTAQCERINIGWGRNGNDTGPPPVAPYFFQIYTSTSETPYVVYAGFGSAFGWDVPFAPNTQYQICMFDSNGVSGGCQATYTVIANTTVTTPTCQNVTAPSELSVSGTVPLGLMSKYGYIDQCTSLSVTPKTGKPPFTLTVAPSFHPPYNLTSDTMDPISWQVSLPVGYRFFLAMSSSDGLLWANGPMQVGGLGPTSCLAPGTISKKEAVSVIVGTGIGGTALGLLIGILVYILLIRVRRRRERAPSHNYFASQYFSSTKPYKAPSIVPSTITPSLQPLRPNQPASSSAFNPASSVSHSSTFTRPSSCSPSLPMSVSSSFSHQTSRNREPPELPLEPLRPNRRSTPRPPLPEPPMTPSSDRGSVQEHFPPDVKRQPPPSSVPDDAAYIASSSSNVRLPPSSPAYSQHPLPRQVYVIDETEVADVPPEYGRHTDDTTCTPSIISSGRVPSGRF
ncbi:hypothetical protein BYT27DRAFT_6668872 [Phlegmacium glaucopus]|nr:hypothetical protein BYT27DRAFT_6668872 [Phlegmacium glaucopus]